MMNKVQQINQIIYSDHNLQFVKLWSSLPVVISADAHNADHLTRNFAEAEKLLQELGI